MKFSKWGANGSRVGSSNGGRIILQKNHRSYLRTYWLVMRMTLHRGESVNLEKRIEAAFTVINGLDLSERLEHQVKLFARGRLEAGARLGGFTVKLSKLPRGKSVKAVRVYWWDESRLGSIKTSYNEFYEKH